MKGGRQQVNWAGTLSGFVEVKFGVRQGSILGPLLFLILMADLPGALKLFDEWLVGYVDDVALWASDKDPEVLREQLTRHAMNFAQFVQDRGLVLNAGKTQLMWSGSGKNTALVTVQGENIKPSNSLELLGVTFDSKLSLEPHLAAVSRAARVRTGMVARLSCHLPCGQYLTQLARGITLGKVGYAIAAVATPRLEGNTCNPSSNSMAIQIAMNDVARSVLGCTRKDHVKIQDLLSRAHIPSFNAVSVRAIAMETWKAHHSVDEPDG